METSDVTRTLCLACGLCCNGVLFKNVELQAGDNAAALQNAGLPIQRQRRKITFRQPCPVLRADNHCAIYAARPARCREFECALFKSVAAGNLDAASALKTIRTARLQADKVRRLLERAGDTNDSLPLNLRFKRVQRLCERGSPNTNTNTNTRDPGIPAADTFSELTLAVHRLNVILSRRFYPA